MPSFDVVSEINMDEVRNATENANRELSTRFDFRGVEASFEYKDKTVLMTAQAEFQLQQMESMFILTPYKSYCSLAEIQTGVVFQQQ